MKNQEVLMKFRPFEEARAFVQTLGLKNWDAWQAYCRSGKKPADIPANPYLTYKEAFHGFGDWLGTGTLSTRARTFLPFAEARAFVHTLELSNQYEWRAYCRSGRKPANIPTNPRQTYKEAWKGFSDWSEFQHNPEMK